MVEHEEYREMALLFIRFRVIYVLPKRTSGSEDQWEAVNAADRDAENGVQPTRELEALRSTCRVAILYALGYLYEHRDEADHHQLMLTLRSILFAVREGVF